MDALANGAMMMAPNLNLIKANPNEYNDQIPTPSSVIYSFCFDSTDGKKNYFIHVMDIDFMKYIIIIKINQMIYIMYPKLFL